MSTTLLLNDFYSSDEPCPHYTYIYYTPNLLEQEESSTEDRATYVLFIDWDLVKGLWGVGAIHAHNIYSIIQETFSHLIFL